MDKITLVKAIRQLCQAGICKLDVSVLPEVVVKEHKQSLDNLKTLVDQTQVALKHKAKMYELIRKAGEFESICRRDGYALRGRLLRIDSSLPSLIDLSKGKLL